MEAIKREGKCEYECPFCRLAFEANLVYLSCPAKVQCPTCWEYLDIPGSGIKVLAGVDAILARPAMYTDADVEDLLATHDAAVRAGYPSGLGSAEDVEKLRELLRSRRRVTR
jgi:hypothetical protein